MKIKIAHISTMPTGGAGTAAIRVHHSFVDSKDIDSVFIQSGPLTKEDTKQNIYRCTPFQPLLYLYRIINKLGLASLLTQKGRLIKAIQKHQSSSHYEVVTIPISLFPIEEHPLVKDADIVHLHWVGHFLNYPAFFNKIKQPIVWTLHDMNPFQGIFHYEEDMERNISLKEIDREVFSKKKEIINKKKNITIVSPSEWLKQKSEQSEILGRYPHFLIPYGLNIDYYPLLDRNNVKQKMNVDNGLKTLLFVAHSISVYRKGFDILLEAVEKLKNQKFNVLTLGKDHLSINNKNVNHIHINATSDLELINTIYSAADITIIPSREDNLPNVMLESMFNGTPVISFPNGGMAEHIQNDKNGILVNNIDSNDLAKTIRDFLNEKYAFNSELIREYACKTFSKEIQAKAYTKLYKDILNK